MVGMLIATISTFGLIGNMANVLGADSLLSGIILVALGIMLGENWCNHGKEGRNDENARTGCLCTRWLVCRRIYRNRRCHRTARS